MLLSREELFTLVCACQGIVKHVFVLRYIFSCNYDISLSKLYYMFLYQHISMKCSSCVYIFVNVNVLHVFTDFMSVSTMYYIVYMACSACVYMNILHALLVFT